jgi:hypothetical protein
MLAEVAASPEMLAYDRPSPKLISFLAKHYSLFHKMLQPNKFVTFRGFFAGADLQGFPNDAWQSFSKLEVQVHYAHDLQHLRYIHGCDMVEDICRAKI